MVDQPNPSTIRASWGIFYDTFKLELPRGSFGGDKWLQRYYTLDIADWTTIGVSPSFRGKGLGELLLVDLFERAWERNAEWLTLEVRVSNEAATLL